MSQWRSSLGIPQIDAAFHIVHNHSTEETSNSYFRQTTERVLVQICKLVNFAVASADGSLDLRQFACGNVKQFFVCLI
jgi:hypothetical protein